MDQIAQISPAEREELFRETANARSVHFQIIEKDFWVCWTLKRLFGLSEIGPEMVFKGGTSLSKAYKVIERFSEDIDIAINRSFLGIGSDDEVQALSSNKRNATIKELDLLCRDKVQTVILPSLLEIISEKIGPASYGNWHLSTDENDPYGQTILFAYPRSSENPSGTELDYIRPVVKIEMGARPTNEPVEDHSIQSYASEEFPGVFGTPHFQIKVLQAKRTFWEKATILHDQHHRDESYKKAERISRHYYDLYKLSKSRYAADALADRELLRRVVQNKKLFFSRAGAKYDEAVNGNIHLIPVRPT